MPAVEEPTRNPEEEVCQFQGCFPVGKAIMNYTPVTHLLLAPLLLRVSSSLYGVAWNGVEYDGSKLNKCRSGRGLH